MHVCCNGFLPREIHQCRLKCRLVLKVPHSNTGEEMVQPHSFDIIAITLSSLLIKPRHKFNSSSSMLSAVKQATRLYNLHTGNSYEQRVFRTCSCVQYIRRKSVQLLMLISICVGAVNCVAFQKLTGLKKFYRYERSYFLKMLSL